LQDGATVVPFPSVLVNQTDSSGKLQTYFAQFDDASGHYLVANVPLGNFTVNSQNNTGLNGSTTGTLTSITVAAIANVNLQAGGTVAGTVLDAAGNPISSTQVSLSSSSLPLDLFATTDESGHYQFTGVVTGPFRVQTVDGSGSHFASATGLVSSDGETVTVNLTVQATGTVTGSIFQSDGATAASSASATINNFDNIGSDGWFAQSILGLPPTGTFQMSGIDAGHLRVSAFDSGSQQAGVAYVTLIPPTPANVTVTLGNAVRNGTSLTGSDGFVYNIGCDATVLSGGASAVAPILQESSLTVAQRDLTCNVNDQVTDQGGRQIYVEGLTPVGVVNITRKIFSPTAGGFARHLEYLTNTGAAPVTIFVVQQGSSGTLGTVQVVDTPASTANTYAVMNSSQSGTSGFVFAGSGAATSVVAASFNNFVPIYLYGWNVTIPAGQTVILMHFVIVRGPADVAGAETQAKELVNMSDPNALLGMTAAEKSEVVNFNVPH
jgi:hypothetical protein